MMPFGRIQDRINGLDLKHGDFWELMIQQPFVNRVARSAAMEYGIRDGRY